MMNPRSIQHYTKAINMKYYIRYSEVNQTKIFLPNKKYFLKPYDSDVYGLAKIPPSMKGY